MTNDVRAQIERTVEAEHGWKSAVQIIELSSVPMASCRFFNVVRKDSKEPFGLSYAALANGELISFADKEAATRILDACGKPSAAGWAEVLARFHPEVAPGTVLYDKEKARTAIERLEAAGGSFAPPSLTLGKDEITVRFFLMNYETGVLSEVTATRKLEGTLSVNKKRA